VPSGFDVLSQVLNSLHLAGSISEVFSPATPWGFSFPASDHARLLVVTRGRVHFALEDQPGSALDLGPGDVVAVAHGDALSIRDDPRSPVHPITEHRSADVAHGSHRLRGGQTEFIPVCCELSGGRMNLVTKNLPPVIFCPGSDEQVRRWLEPAVRILAAEGFCSVPGRQAVLDHLASILFIQVIRTWVAGLREGEGGWLRALNDPQIAAALEAIHAEPGAGWTVENLAARGGMSRSAFAVRFHALVGATPLEYLTRWRMQRAAAMLEDDGIPLKQVVASAGYASETAFRAAFKKWVGVAPGAYRNRPRTAAGLTDGSGRPRPAAGLTDGSGRPRPTVPA